jgi:hypothetical protein
MTRIVDVPHDEQLDRIRIKGGAVDDVACAVGLWQATADRVLKGL